MCVIPRAARTYSPVALGYVLTGLSAPLALTGLIFKVPHSTANEAHVYNGNVRYRPFCIARTIGVCLTTPYRLLYSPHARAVGWMAATVTNGN